MQQSGFEIRDKNYLARTRRGFAGQAFMSFLGAELVDVAPGQVEIRLPYRPELSQQHGYFHGGAIGALADVTGGFAAFTLMAARSSILTVEYKLNIMSPAQGDFLIGRGCVMKPGRRLSVAKADLFSQSDGREQLCATMLGTFMAVEERRDVAAII